MSTLPTDLCILMTYIGPDGEQYEIDIFGNKVAVKRPQFLITIPNSAPWSHTMNMGIVLTTWAYG